MTSTVLTDVLKAKTTNGSLTISGNGTGNVDMKNLATTDDTPMVLTLQTGETDIAANDVIGQIDFQAPDEGTGTDAILVAAGIEAVSEGDFSSSNNATKLSFKTAASQAAAEKASLSSTGVFTATSFTGSGAGLTAGTTPLTTLDIDGGTDIGEAIVDADLFIIDNGAGGTNRKVAASRLKTYNPGGVQWQAVVTSATTMVAGRGYFVNTTSSAFTMTLPASPSIGDYVRIIDYAGTFDSNTCTIGRNSEKIAGASADMTVTTERAGLELVYVDSTQGWLLTEK